MFKKGEIGIKEVVGLIIFVGLLIVLVAIILGGKETLVNIADKLEITSLKELFGWKKEGIWSLAL